MYKKTKKISIIIPCLNEEKSIGKVIDAIPVDRLLFLGFTTEVIIIDNNSDDKTANVAKRHNAKIIVETKKGKGHAILTGLRSIEKDTDYIVMLDGDNTYKPKEIIRMIEPLDSDFCDVIIGSRLGGKTRNNSLTFMNRVGNWFYTFLVRQIYRANTTDVLSGYFAWKKEVIDNLIDHLDSTGFEIEMEMIIKMVKLNYEIYSVPITYEPREGKSKLVPYSDGIRITHTLLKNILWKPTSTNTKRHKNERLRSSYSKV